jgi:general secretion pathway protein K
MRSLRQITRTESQGFVLVAVLWILSALGAMASIYAVYVTNTAAAIAVNGDAIEFEGLVTAAVELTTHRLLEDPSENRPTRGTFDFRLGRANVGVEFRSEAARIDLNEATKDVLAGLFTVVGANPNDAVQYGDRVLGWRTAPRANAPNPESVFYKSAGLNYGPRGARFEHIGELGLLAGVPPVLIERVLPFVTVFSGSDKVSLRDAAPEVLAALAAAQPSRASDFPGNGPPLSRAADTNSGSPSGSPRSAVAAESQAAIRIIALINFDNGRRRGAEVVILVGSGTDEPYRVLSWHDNFEDLVDGRFDSGRRR